MVASYWSSTTHALSFDKAICDWYESLLRQRERVGIDFCSYYFLLLLQLELLFADEKVLAEEAYATEGWVALTAQRKDLVGLSTAKACVGMATAVLQRGSKGGKGGAKEESTRNEQADLVHTLRLLLEAERLIQGVGFLLLAVAIVS